MRKLKFILLCFLVACLLLTGCSNKNTKVDANEIVKSSAAITNEKLKKNNNADTFSLTFWNYALDKSYIEKTFKEMYPKAKINIVDFNGTDSDKVTKALTTDNAPDIVIYSSDQFGDFNALDVFESLSQANYNINDIKSIFSKNELAQCMSLNEKKLIALPFTAAPMVTYYRADILQKYGIPTDPTELGNLMEDKEQWLSIAKKLKKDNIYIIQWKDELLKIALNEYGYFDKDMNLTVDNEKVKESLSITKETYTLDLTGNYDLWNDVGKKAIKDGNVAMLYMHKWAENYIKDFAPETSGKWRATRLPLGMYCSSGLNNISISSSCKYKQQALKLVKKLVTNDRKYYSSIKNNESAFLGGQKSNVLYEEISRKIPRRYQTALDDKIFTIFFDNVNSYINSDTNTILDTTKLKINNSTFKEQKGLKRYIKGN